AAGGDASPGRLRPGARADPEDLARIEEGLDATFDSLEGHLGELDREQALDEALPIFAEILAHDPSANVGDALGQALYAGAESAAATRRGASHVERLIDAELVRVGPDVDRAAIWRAADEFLPALLEQEEDPQEAARLAI